MHRLLRFVLGVSALALVLASCGRPSAPSVLTTADVLRCEPADGSGTSYREASAALIEAARNDPSRASDELIIAYEAPRRRFGFLGVRRDPAPAVRRDFGLAVRRSLGEGRDVVTAPDPLATAQRLLDDPRVLYAHPSVRLRPHAVPGDPAYGRQWNLSRFGSEAGWDVERGSEDVTIAIIDAGLDVAHPEFAGRLEPGWDFYGDGTDESAGDADVTSRSNHGTHVTGIAAATGDNGEGIAGVAHANVRILPIKVFADDPRDSNDKTLAAVSTAIRWAAGLDVGGVPETRAAPVQVVNLSLGTDGSYLNVPVLDEAIRAARSQGVVVVASVGNQGSSAGVTSPANSPCALAVASVDESLARSSFSNFDGEERRVDLAAPGGFSATGQGIYSTINGDDGVLADGYGTMHGTSMSAPYVSGVAALVASLHPGWDDERILDLLLRTAYLPSTSSEMELGFGVACIDAALGAPTRCGR